MSYRFVTPLAAALAGIGLSLFGGAAMAQDLPQKTEAGPVEADLSKIISPGHAYRKWLPWFEFGGAYGTDNASRGEVTLFAPLAQNESSLTFIEARGKFFEQDTQEINFAFGHRVMHSSGWNFGAWAGVDGRSTEVDNKFWQFSGGFEALSDRFDLRVNGYMPVTDPKSAPSLATVALTGNGIFITGAQEVPLHGVDGEIGVKIFDWQNEASGEGGLLEDIRTELRIFAGGFYFNADEAVEEIAGFRTRVEFRVDNVIAPLPGSRLTFETEFSHDDVRNSKWEIGARLRIPVGKPSTSRVAYAGLTPQERRMTEALERDTDIIAGRSGTEGAIDNATNVALNQVVFGNDEASIAAATAQGANTLIIVEGTGAPIDVTTIALQTDQTIQGGGSTIQLRGASTGAIVDFTAPGQRPTLTNMGGGAGPLITLASNNHIAGFDLDIAQALGGGEGAYVGIYGAGGLTNTNIEIAGVNILNTGAVGTGAGTAGSDGILIRDGADVRISDVMVMNVLGDGFNFFNVDGASLSTVHVENASRAGMLFGAASNNIELSNFSITNAGITGLALFNSNNFTVENGTISGTGGFAPEAKAINIDNVMSASFSNMVISNTTSVPAMADALAFNARGSTGITISNSQFDHQRTGIRFLNTSGSVTNTLISNTTGVSGTTGRAVWLKTNGGTSDIDLTNVEIDSATVGLRMDGRGTINISGTGNTTTNTTVPCSKNMGITINGTVEIDGFPEPGTTC